MLQCLLYVVRRVLIAVQQPPYIYHGCSAWKTFWEVNFTLGEFTDVNMENCGCSNDGKHREIKGSDNYITLDISLKFESLDKMIITSQSQNIIWEDQERG